MLLGPTTENDRVVRAAEKVPLVVVRATQMLPVVPFGREAKV